MGFFKKLAQVWCGFLLITAAYNEGVLCDDMDNQGEFRVVQLSLIGPALLRLSESIEKFGAAHLVLNNGEHIVSEATDVAYDPPKKDGVPTGMTILLASGLRVVIKKDSVKAYDKDMHIVLDSSEGANGEDGEKDDMGPPKVANDLTEGRQNAQMACMLQGGRCQGGSCGAIRTVHKSFYRPGHCTYRSGIMGSYNPCLTPAGGMMRNFDPQGGSTLLRGHL